MTGVRPNLDLGVVGNCQVSALVDDQGRIVWMCLPRPDGDPVFSALLTPEGAPPQTACLRSIWQISSRRNRVTVATRQWSRRSFATRTAARYGSGISVRVIGPVAGCSGR